MDLWTIKSANPQDLNWVGHLADVKWTMSFEETRFTIPIDHDACSDAGITFWRFGVTPITFENLHRAFKVRR